MQAGAHRIEATLSGLTSSDVTDTEVVDSLCRIWQGVGNELSPIIGRQGVAALWRRSVLITQPSHTWLDQVVRPSLEQSDFELLRAALISQPRIAAIEANDALLRSFYDLLSGLIGESLTDRLLSAVLPQPTAGSAVQDPSQ